jgi:hypothetical protein
MIDLQKYTDINHTHTFGNGKTFDIYSKPTKKGIRYFYYSLGNSRMMPISKKEIGIL